MFFFQYSQPRPASYDPKVPIYERRELHIEGEDEEAAREEIARILSEGSVVCGDKTCNRQFISLTSLPPFCPATGPKPELISPNECPV